MYINKIHNINFHPCSNNQHIIVYKAISHYTEAVCITLYKMSTWAKESACWAFNVCISASARVTLVTFVLAYVTNLTH